MICLSELYNLYNIWYINLNEEKLTPEFGGIYLKSDEEKKKKMPTLLKDQSIVLGKTFFPNNNNNKQNEQTLFVLMTE